MPRVFTVHTPLGPEALKFQSLSGREQVSRLFEFHLDMLGASPDISVDSLLGQNVTVEVETQSQGRRWLNGEVTRFALIGRDGRYYRYQAVLRPWMWYMARATDCRIFQNMDAPSILAEMFSKYPSLVDYRLTGNYRTWEYCVQYQETDFNFVSRLMEHEGIYYFFEHAMGQLTLVLADSMGAHKPVPEYASIPYISADAATVADEEHVESWIVSKEVDSGGFVTDDYDFKKPRANLQQTKNHPFGHPNDSYKVFDFPGGYTELAEGDFYAKVRLEEAQASHEILQGESNARGVAPGYLFDLYRCPRADQNREYLILGVNYYWKENPYSSAGEEGTLFSFTLSCHDSSQPFRPERLTPKPLTNGPQTAAVVGPAGEEIYTDKYGRVKVQFHWDRYGKRDENSSCWIRVSHAWAGTNYGGIYIPRIGQEVIVDFIAGDPDYPIITGRVYNADEMPPWSLPAHKTQSGVVTRSTPKGTPDHENLIRFEDKKGDEEIHVHAQRNLVTVVEHDEIRKIGNNRDTETGNNHTEKIANNMELLVGSNQDVHVGSNKAETIGSNLDLDVGGNRNESVGASQSLTVGMNQQEKVGMNHALEAGMQIHLKAGMTVVIEAGVQLSLKGPGGFVDIGPAGVTIQGTMVLINSGGAAGQGSGSNPEKPTKAKKAQPAKPTLERT